VYRNLLVSRVLLSLAAVIYLFGAVMHANAFFKKASYIIEGSELKAFFSSELKVLWLADSTTLIGLAIIFGLIAARPAWATRPLILVLSWIPAATTALLYFFLGSFYAAHLLLAATLMVIVAALLLPTRRSQPRAASGLAIHPASSNLGDRFGGN
jgi:hypothetical protein